MPYAVVDVGGRQIRVAPGELVRVDRLNEPAGEKVTFEDVRLIAKGKQIKIGTPSVEGARVRATVVEERRDRKVIVFKKKRRKQYRRTRGHRQWFSVVRIDKIEA